MRILITNDDGINAPGLKVAKKIAKSIIENKKGEITIIAPSSEKSGVSHSISFVRPSLIQKINKNKYSLEGTPADCILAGINYVMKNKKPDLIISGVNLGRNISDDILYSGTVGAAMEGALNGIKSIALSQQYSKKTYKSDNPFKCALKYGTDICNKILNDNPFSNPKFTGFYNVNFPACSSKEVNGHKICNIGQRKKPTFTMVAQSNTKNRNFLWIKHNLQKLDPFVEMDEYYLNKNYITISALKTDLTWIEKNKELNKIFKIKKGTKHY